MQKLERDQFTTRDEQILEKILIDRLTYVIDDKLR